jgi:hypothetical protein
MVDRREMGDPPAHRHPYEMGALQAQCIEQAHRIRFQIA